MTTENERPCQISVVIPCFNEERRLAETLPVVREFLEGRYAAWEIIVVDDGSTDATSTVAEQADDGRVRVLRHEPNRGKGFAVRQGAMHSRGDLVLVTDADLSTPLEELDRLEEAVAKGCAIAIGSRALERGRIAVRQAWWRDRLGRLFNLAIRALGVSGFSDTQCGFKLFTKDASRAVFPNLAIERWTWDVEALHVARLLGLPVAEVPVRWSNSPDTRVSVLRDAAGTLRDLLRIRLRWILRRPKNPR